MYAVVLLVLVAIISLLITRVATIALTVTGMARPPARFQARSALSGVGFTTSEAEAVVTHPVRRRIVMALMLFGNAGLVTAIAGLLAGFARADAGQGLFRAVLLVLGLATVYALSRSSVVDRNLSRVIERMLRRYTDLDVRDYEQLLHLSGEYSVKEMPVEDGHWLADQTLGELRLRDEGVVVLGIARREGSYVGAPDKATELHPGDTLILYGRDSILLGLSHRDAGPPGDRAHEEAVANQEALSADQEGQDSRESA